MKVVECSAYPTTNRTNENVSQLKECFLSNTIITVCEVADMMGISFQSLQSNWPDSLNASDRFFPLDNVPAHCALCMNL
jgi:hypothetical protein